MAIYPVGDFNFTSRMVAHKLEAWNIKGVASMRTMWQLQKHSQQPVVSLKPGILDSRFVWTKLALVPVCADLHI